jgi:membrane protein DedA with SNARE-associated domain
MYTYLAIVAVVGATFAAVISYAVARRYGWTAALIMPFLALVTTTAMFWQRNGLSAADLPVLFVSALIYAAPTVLGTLLGTAIAMRRKA